MRAWRSAISGVTPTTTSSARRRTAASGRTRRIARSTRSRRRPTGTSPRSIAGGRPKSRRSSRSDVARAPLARPTDAPPTAHEASGATVPTSQPADASAEPFLPPEELPRHVAIIMDGNRRWARQHERPELEGHAAGVEAIREILRHAVRRGVRVMTLYAFSRENWARSDDEVTGLFQLLEGAIRSETDELRRQGVHVRLLGRLDELPDETRRSIGEALDATA